MKEINTCALVKFLVSSISSLLDHHLSLLLINNYTILLFNYVDGLSHCLFYDIMCTSYTSESYIFYVLHSIYNPSIIYIPIPLVSLNKLEYDTFQ
jgi:hypothetical protein